jgi:hypothetical protein
VPPARIRLALEELEDRSLLSASAANPNYIIQPPSPSPAPPIVTTPASPPVVSPASPPVVSPASPLAHKPGYAYTDYIIHQASSGMSPYAVPPGGYAPIDIRKAYGFNKITDGGAKTDGTGITIAIVDAFDDPNIVSDLATFDAKFGLPGTTAAGVASFFKKVNQSGGAALPNPDAGWAGEISLDVEWVHALAPGAKIILVEANDNSNANLLDAAVKWAGTKSGAQVVSMSFGVDGGFPGETAYDSDFAQPGGYGVTYLASTGDSMAPGGYPAESPNVVAVGGTSLTTDAAGNWKSESVWENSPFPGDGGGGSVSMFEAKPAYQKGVAGVTAVDPGNFRATPDVAFDADPATGVAIYDSYGQPGWLQIGGTSFACPAWAALVGITDEVRANHGLPSLAGTTQTLPRLYSIYQNAGQYSNDFHDITTGSNGNPALPGYDLSTGIGTPIANNLVPDLAGITLGPPPPPPIPGVSITGRVFQDVGHAGSESPTDPGLGSVTVYLDKTGVGHYVNGDPAVRTNPDGTYQFRNLAPGVYQVGALVQPGYAQSTPAAGGETTVFVSANTTRFFIDFGDYKLGPSTTVDDSDRSGNFRMVGRGWTFQAGGLNNESYTHAGTFSPGTYAQWTTTASRISTSGYELYATWTAKSTNATNASYEIYDQATGTLLGTVTEDQTQSPTQANVNGTFYQELGNFKSTNGQFIIKLQTAGANGNVVADAIVEAIPLQSPSFTSFTSAASLASSRTVASAPVAYPASAPSSPTGSSTTSSIDHYFIQLGSTSGSTMPPPPQHMGATQAPRSGSGAFSSTVTYTMPAQQPTSADPYALFYQKKSGSGSANSSAQV